MTEAVQVASVQGWSDVEAAVASVDRVLSAVGNLAGWEPEEPVYATTLIRSCGSVAGQLAVLVSMGYVTLSRDGQNTTVSITKAGIESVTGADNWDGRVCSACSGSGEGMHEGGCCLACGGSGDDLHRWGTARWAVVEDGPEYEPDDAMDGDE